MADAAELDLRVLKTIRVNVPIERAFAVFVEQMESWWPPTHHIGDIPFVAIFVEPRLGGRWYERNAQGQECEWGRVLAWDPPHMVRLSWHAGPGHDSPDWVMDPDISKASEVEIRFHAEGPHATLVELEHSKIERHHGATVELRDKFDQPGAWIAILESFAKKAERAATETRAPREREGAA